MKLYGIDFLVFAFVAYALGSYLYSRYAAKTGGSIVPGKGHGYWGAIVVFFSFLLFIQQNRDILHSMTPTTGTLIVFVGSLLVALGTMTVVGPRIISAMSTWTPKKGFVFAFVQAGALFSIFVAAISGFVWFK